MDRRDFVESCALGAGALAATLAGPGWAATVVPRSYARTVLVARPRAHWAASFSRHFFASTK